MNKYIIAALLFLAACKTTEVAPVDCKDRMTQFGEAQRAAGHKFEQQGLLAPNTFAIAFADDTTYFVLGLVAPGGVIPPPPFIREGSCVAQGDIAVQVYTGEIRKKVHEARAQNAY